MKIRKANKKDIEPIVKLNIQLADFHVKLDNFYKTGKESAEGFKKYLKEIMAKRNYQITVAEDQRKIIGFFISHIDNSKPYAKPKKIGGISTAFVCKEYRRSGVGKAMFENLLIWFRKNKVKNIELSVDFRNEIGGNAWKKFGFKDFMRRMRLDL